MRASRRVRREAAGLRDAADALAAGVAPLTQALGEVRDGLSDARRHGWG